MDSNLSSINYSKLPNFLVIGAPKCGTTSLHSVLGQHPQIFISKVKEPHFFERDLYSNGLEWYQEKYFHDADGYFARGESTPNYLTLSTIVAPRIKEAFGENDLKFIAIFRDPAKRAYSEYWFRRRRYKESVTFEEALQNEWQGKRSDWDSLYKGGCYATLLEPFLDRFQRRKFYFILLEDLVNDFNGAMKGITKFLSVSEDFEFKPVTENQSYVIKSKKIHSITKNPSDPIHRIGKILTHLLPREKVLSIKKMIIKNNLTKEKYPPLEKELELILREKYHEEIQKLEFIMGRDLSNWY
jgi:hypothetical protein